MAKLKTASIRGKVNGSHRAKSTARKALRHSSRADQLVNNSSLAAKILYESEIQVLDSITIKKKAELKKKYKEYMSV